MFVASVLMIGIIICYLMLADSRAKNISHTEEAQTVNSTATFVKFIRWCMEDWMFKVGALFLLLGVSWFVGLVVKNSWVYVPPEVRVGIGIIVGIGIMGGGSWRIKKYLSQGSILLVLGSGIVISSVYLARTLYGFFTPVTALIIMFVATAGLAVIGDIYKSRALAILSSITYLFVIPFLSELSFDQDGVALLFSYLFVVILGTAYLTVKTKDNVLMAISFAGVFWYSVLNLIEFRSGVHSIVFIVFTVIFNAIFYVLTAHSIIKNTAGAGKNSSLAVAVMVMNSFLPMMIAAVVFEDRILRALYLSIQLVIIVLLTLRIYLTEGKTLVYYYGGVSFAYLLVVSSLILTGAASTVALILEIGLLPILVRHSLKNTAALTVLNYLLVFVILAVLTKCHVTNWLHGMFNSDFFMLVTLGTVLIVRGVYFILSAAEEDKVKIVSSYFNRGIIAFGGFLLLFVIDMSFLVELSSPANIVATLVTFSAIGVTAYQLGGIKNIPEIRLSGALLVLLVVARVGFVDFWVLLPIYRIITAIVIGTMLMATAFIKKVRY